MKRYIYKGPRSAVELRHGDKLIERELIPGQPVDLPPEHEYTQVLVCLRQLVELADTTPAPTATHVPTPEPAAKAVKKTTSAGAE